MSKITSFEELNNIYEASKNLLSIRKATGVYTFDCEKNNYRKEILICGGTGCKSAQSNLIKSNLEEELKKLNIENEIYVSITGCFGFCE